MDRRTHLPRDLLRYLFFAAALVGAATLLLAQPPERSPLLFALLVLAALLVASLDRARRAGVGPHDVARFLARQAATFCRARRAADPAPPLAQTLARPLPPLQFAAEVILVALAATAVTHPFLAPDPALQLPGREAEWLTSSAYLAADALRQHGYIPLWQPYLEFGEPLVDNPFSFVLNPLSAGPSLLEGGARGIRLSVVLSALLAGWGGWVLARVLGCGALGRLLLALLLLGKGNMHAMIGAGYFQLGVSQAYMPWVVAGAVATLRLPRRRWSLPQRRGWPPVLTAVAFTLLFWAGNIWYTLPMLISLALLALTHALRPARRLDWPAPRRLALAAVFTVGLSAVTLLPLWINRAHIGGHPDEIGAGRVADLARVVEQFYNGDIQTYLEGRAPGTAHFYYSFVTPLWFAALLFALLPPVFPFLHRPALPGAWRVWLVGVVMVVFATVWGAGGNPLIIWLYDHIPLLGQWRFVGRALAVASFWLAVLLAMRADGLWRALRHPAWTRWLAALPPVVPRLRHALALGLILACALAAQQVNAQWHVFTGTVGPNVYDEACLAWLRAQHPQEPLAAYRLGYDAVIPFLRHRVRLFNIEADFTPLPLPRTQGHIDLTQSLPGYGLAWDEAGRRWLSEHGYRPLPGSPAPVDGHPCLYRLDAALSYAYSIPQPVLNGVRTPQLNPALTDPLHAVHHTPDTVTLTVEARRGLPLVVTIQERAYPGWQVWVDGQPAQLESVGGQVGVLLPPDGALHHIRFAYRPPLLYLGGALTLFTAALCLLYLLGADARLAPALRARLRLPRRR